MKFIPLQFFVQFSGQFKPSDKAVDCPVLCNLILVIYDLKHQPALWFIQRFDELLMAVLDFF